LPDDFVCIPHSAYPGLRPAPSTRSSVATVEFFGSQFGATLPCGFAAHHKLVSDSVPRGPSVIAYFTALLQQLASLAAQLSLRGVNLDGCRNRLTLAIELSPDFFPKSVWRLRVTLDAFD